MPNPFVVISGLPGSGKTTLARRLAPALGLTLIDKDDILERLFNERGTGDAAWRRALSRESDIVLAREAARVDGAVLASFWRLAGMRDDSGTPTAWLAELANPIINVHCDVDPEVAARRFIQRQRHPGHLDAETSHAAVLASIRDVASLGMPEFARRLVLDTSLQPSIEQVVSGIDALLDSLPGPA
jgi:glucokinase